MRLVTAAVVGGWGFASPAPLAAQTSPPELVAPRALDAGRVPYPQGASGEAVVVCEVVVDEAGAVRSARIVSGERDAAGQRTAPFAEAVLAAAPAWRFEPARRGDAAVAARIRLRVAFTPPTRRAPPSEPGAAPPGTPIAPLPPAPVAPAVEEVTVLGAREEIGETRFGGGEVREVPGAFGDAFRVMEALPGVTPIVSGLPFFFVRGAPPGNVGYFLDGVRLPLLYHLGAGPSIVHPALIENVEFWAGGYPAKYGRFAGGILAGETKAPSRRARGEASVRLFDAGLLGETPFADGRGSVLVGGRYSYTAAVLSLVAPNTRLAYWDYQLRVGWALGPRDRVSLFVFGSHDDLASRDRSTDPFRPVFNTQFHRADLRWDHALGAGQMRVALTLGQDSTLFEQSSSGSTSNASTLRTRLLGARVEIDTKASEHVRVRAGADAWVEVYDRDTGSGMASRNDPLSVVYPARTELVGGVRADAVWRPTPRVELVPGVRVDAWVQRREVGLAFPVSIARPATSTLVVPGVDPRLAARIGLGHGVAWLGTVGLAHQPPSFFVPVPGLRPGGLGAGLQTSAQMSQGIEVALPWELTSSLTGFVHNYLDLTDITATCSRLDGASDVDDSCVEQRVRGRTIGLELLVRRPLTRRLTGWLSYTLSRSTRETRPARFRNPYYGLIGGAVASADIPSEFDRTHVLSLVGAYDLGRGWRLGGRFFFYTGRPFTRTLGGYPALPFNAERMPSFTRLDLRIEKRWRIGATGQIGVVLEGLNVLAQKEVVNMRCEARYVGSSSARVPELDACSPEEIGPITIPSLGVEGSF